MPKIPLYKSSVEMTTQSPSVESNIQIDPSQNIFKATKSATDFLTNEYVKEAKLEADNKATLALNELFINQEDGTKGFYSIQSNTKTNGNPLEAAELFDQDVNKLWNYAQNNKLKDFNNFTKKALEKKFYATAGLFKAKALLGSRKQQLLDTKTITDDLVLKESMALVLNGIEYLPKYENTIRERLSSDPNIVNKGVFEQELNTALIFGELKLAENLASENPYKLKEDINLFKNLNITQKSQLLKTADESILKNNQLYFTSGLEITEDSTADSIFKNYEEIKNGTFNGSIEKIKLWNSLSSSTKASVIDYAKTLRRQNTSEVNNRNTAILNQEKDKSINNYNKIFTDSKALETINLLKVNQVFGEPKNDYELNSKFQMVELSTKIGEKEFSNVNNYYKNFEIQKAILSGVVKDHITPFILDGETQAKSITQRVGDGISKNEFGYYLNYLLPNIDNNNFVKSHKKLYSVIESLQSTIEGPSSIKYLDTTLDNRLNNFQSNMIFKFSKGLKEGKNSDDMLDPNNKLFIGKDFRSYQPDKDYLTKILSEKASESTDKDVILPPPWNPEKYKTYEDYINSKEYKEYLIKKQEQ